MKAIYITFRILVIAITMAFLLFCIYYCEPEIVNGVAYYHNFHGIGGKSETFIKILEPPEIIVLWKYSFDNGAKVKFGTTYNIDSEQWYGNVYLTLPSFYEGNKPTN